MSGGGEGDMEEQLAVKVAQAKPRLRVYGMHFWTEAHYWHWLPIVIPFRHDTLMQQHFVIFGLFGKQSIARLVIHA